MHLIVLILIVLIAIPNCAFAQHRNVDSYTPPPMFGGEVNDGDSTDTPAALPEERSSNNLDLTNLDSISRRGNDTLPDGNSTQAKRPAPSKAFKPPLPPRRPAAFQVSQDYLDRITAPSPKTPMKPGKSVPVISSPALSGDAFSADLLAMDVMDIYENLSGKTSPAKNFINIPPLRGAAPEPVLRAEGLQLAFTDNSTNLTEAHAIKIDKELLPLLKTGGARLIIEAPAPHDADKQQQRLALSRALAIRNYLELNGIERGHITLNQTRRDAVLSGSNAISMKLSE